MKVMSTPSEFSHFIHENSLGIIQFGQESCMPCHAIRQRLSQWSEEHGLPFLYIPLEDFPEVAAQNGVFSAPTVCVYAEGHIALRESGYFSLDTLLQHTLRLQEIMTAEQP